MNDKFIMARRRKNNDDPPYPSFTQFLELQERVARLEEATSWMKDKLESIDKRTWYILAGIIVSILVAILGNVI